VVYFSEISTIVNSGPPLDSLWRRLVFLWRQLVSKIMSYISTPDLRRQLYNVIYIYLKYEGQYCSYIPRRRWHHHKAHNSLIYTCQGLILSFVCVWKNNQSAGCFVIEYSLCFNDRELNNKKVPFMWILVNRILSRLPSLTQRKRLKIYLGIGHYFLINSWHNLAVGVFFGFLFSMLCSISGTFDLPN